MHFYSHCLGLLEHIFAWKHVSFHNFVELDATEGYLFVRNSYPLRLEAKTLRVTACPRAPKRNLVSYFHINCTDETRYRIRILFFLCIQTLWMTPTQNPSRRVKFSIFALLPTRSMCYFKAVAHWWSCFYSALFFLQACTRGHGIWSRFHNTLCSGRR